MEYKENDIELLLPRYCEGMATPEEQQRVDAWVYESEEHRRIIKQMQLLYLAADTVNVMGRVDVEKALIKVKSKRNKDKTVGWWGWTQRVAAILFLPLLITLLAVYYGNTNEAVQMLEAKTNPGMTTSIVLSDGTTVYLNSESSLRYPSTFSKNQRAVELKGEAYFEVTTNVEKPFVITTPHQSQIEVLGTSFNVEAYENIPNVSTTLIEGKVNFSFQAGNKRQQVMLNPGEKIVYDSVNGLSQLYKTSGETEVSWKDGKIIFIETPLKEALRMLEKRYNVEFVLKKKHLSDEPFTGTFTNQRLERILEYFKISTNIRWRYMNEADVALQKTRIEIY